MGLYKNNDYSWKLLRIIFRLIFSYNLKIFNLKNNFRLHAFLLKNAINSCNN